MTTGKAKIGRPSGNSDTRARLIEAARTLFQERGYDATSVRAIAGAAGVDAAMINHYFGGKEGLFQEAMDLPVSPAKTFRTVLDGITPANIPARIAAQYVEVWEGEGSGPAMIALLRRAISDPDQVQVLRSRMTEGLLLPIAEVLSSDHPDDAQLRVAVIVSQLFGMMVARHILRLPPLVDLSVEQMRLVIEQAITSIVNADPSTSHPMSETKNQGKQS